MDSNKSIVVIGRGVMGLSCGIRLLEQGFRVDIVARDDLSRITSLAAGAYWWPHKIYPQGRVMTWAHTTLQALMDLARAEDTGVVMQQHLRFCEVADDSAYSLGLLEDWEEIDGAAFGVPCEVAYRVQIPMIDVPRHMRYLEERFRRAGGEIVVRELQSPNELFPAYDLVVNCAGIGARELVGDESVYPIRGQIVRVARPADLDHSIRLVQPGNTLTLILPRTDDCVLGGTTEWDNWSLAPDAAVSQQIIDNCAALVPSLREMPVLEQIAGLRPGRPEVRLELEMAGPAQPLIHNYGHGGGGFTVAWGCADEVSSLASGYFAAR